MAGIEFVEPDPEAGQDEDLHVAPRRRWSPRARRAVRLAAAVALAAVAGSVLVASLHRGSTGASVGGNDVTAVDPDAPPGAHPDTHRTSPSPVATTASVAVDIDCPVVDACEVSFTPPRAVSAALAARLPGVERPDCATVLVKGRPPTLRSRRLTARAGRLSVRVDVEPAAAGTRTHSSAATVGTGTTVSATALDRGFAVTVTVSGPGTQAPGLPTVVALAADRRLLVTA